MQNTEFEQVTPNLWSFVPRPLRDSDRERSGGFTSAVFGSRMHCNEFAEEISKDMLGYLQNDYLREHLHGI
jgi:hypothetical protein